MHEQTRYNFVLNRDGKEEADAWAFRTYKIYRTCLYGGKFHFAKLKDYRPRFLRSLKELRELIYKWFNPSVAQSGQSTPFGAEGFRRFKSCHSDQFSGCNESLAIVSTWNREYAGSNPVAPTNFTVITTYENISNDT